ncbi:hypothetical protein [Blastococcus saxobsidens]|uniref:DUF4352 domain-containing protein n=1 Tax=Blastococcus saxobsidens TaxID=138336 RepID=A0A4Q7Y3S1_9ACTN|nr:hypothetical protein [Blastococcus saxobsidens]RZU30475.1 hypothetical protein BKA19_0091 [Blastococcus saxobsidens]
MRFKSSLPVLVSAVLVLAGCGSSVSEDSSAGPELPDVQTEEEANASADAEAEAGQPERNERGNIVKAIGEEGGLTGPDGDPVLTFAVDSITPDVQCTEDYASPPENGHLTAVQLRVATAPGVSAEDLGFLSVSAYDWNFIGADGVTVTNLDTIATYSCLAQGALFPSDTLRPGSQYAGTLLLDLPAPSGTLVYSPSSVYDGSGWEWQF